MRFSIHTARDRMNNPSKAQARVGVGDSARLVFRPFPVQKSRRGESIGRLSVGIFTSPVHDATAFTAGPGRPRPRPPPTRLHRASRPFPARRLHAGHGGSKRTNELTSSIVPRGTSFHRWVELYFLLSHLILHSSQATATSLVHRN